MTETILSCIKCQIKVWKVKKAKKICTEKRTATYTNSQLCQSMSMY